MPVIYGGSSGYYGGAGQFSIGTTITATTAFLAPFGSAAAPGVSFTSRTDTGLMGNVASSPINMGLVAAGVISLSVNNTTVQLPTAGIFGWNAASDFTGATDLQVVRDAANTFAFKTGANDQLIRKYGGNAGLVEWGSISENLTLSTGGTTTNTAANLLPANSYIEYVTARVTTTVATATSWQLGDATIAGRFTAAQSGAQLTSGATIVGTVHIDLTGTSGPRQTAATTLRVTTVGTPSAGAIRITSYYRTYTAATS